MGRFEVIQEEGIVKSVENGIAAVFITSQTECEHCEAKLFCSTQNLENKIAQAIDPFGLKPGDKVRIEIEGTNILKYVFFIYGVPLIIFLISIIVGLNIFNELKELYAFILSIISITFYFLIYFVLQKKILLKRKEKYLPKIVFVSSPLE